ncbi:FGGY-family carbohydrate kinase [Paenibacillus sp. GCM10027626]|uniref:FGGY-family carbohydrate kinase n=1 Tax=Paenibacillus sp. GCM10027626 TaxID=3273411 RepID=UPI0036328365
MNRQQVPIYLGVDIGTQGVRIVALDDCGEIVSSRSHTFLIGLSREEQDPARWWQSVTACLQDIASELKRQGRLGAVRSMSVTSTSGTVIALDSHYEPLSPALMYSDPRSREEAELCKRIAERNAVQGYKAFNPSAGLPKIVWFVRQHPGIAERIKLWAHAADYILGKLSGVWGVTDYTNALKTGYDLHRLSWPEYLGKELSLPGSWFPEVVSPGTVIGRLDPAIAEATGLPSTVDVVTGMTDGCASQISAGSIRPGEWNTTIGTTMVVKGVTRKPLEDRLGIFYNHRHPDGFWMPGGASNTGADWVSSDYAGADLDELNEAAGRLIPTAWLSYPLKRQGERFPFYSEAAVGFDPPGISAIERYAARMEGVAYMEKLSYDIVERLSGEKVSCVQTSGGASNSQVWLKIRAHVLQKPVVKMTHTEGAAGAAVLAAVPCYHSLSQAAEQLIRPERIVEPDDRSMTRKYEDGYARFVEKLVKLGYYQEESVSDKS